ncbi:hypothetical protein B0I35DRAFT_477973 [Stachybotrys elegans]|uniref:SET domain-containing protein n=1 Tax=Stachybotrys elegans TaxID=80388 RepID=A0A8K0WST9_9HYPO|nr:hypothetical protein B0I35DRAFT_477973 [Stachybotrys elegans]
MDRIETLVSWAVEHGARLHPAVEIYQDADTGLSFRVKPSASSPIGPYETIVSLPGSLALSYLDAEAALPAALLSVGVAALPPHVLGRLVLVAEFLRGRGSRWWPYIQALPQPSQPSAWRLPPFWPAEDAELLDGTNVEVGLKRIRAEVDAELAEARRLLAQHAPDADLARDLSPALYRWAYCIFSSRSFRPSLVLSEAQLARRLPDGVAPDDFSVLLPLFDVGNHSMATPVRWAVQGDVEGKAVALQVGREHRPGEQVFNNYSMKSNAELLLGYGFMVPATEQLHADYVHVRKRGAANPADEYLISLRPMGHASSALGRSKQPAAFSALLGADMLSAFQHVQPDMVWDIFCALAPTDEQRAHLLSGCGDDDAARLRSFFAGRVGEECRMYLEQTAAIIQHKILQELERLDESDFEVDGAGELERNQRLALEYRAACRRVLESTLEAMNADEVLGQEEE